jgi:hypothetical protein
MEPTPPELGANTGSPRELVFESREELLYLLGEAAELEHSIFCAYLYAAFTFQAEPEAGLTAAQVPTVAGWKRAINQLALQEMIHLALANNLLAALGGSASSRPPQPSPALSLRTRDPADPGAVQRTDAAAIPPHRAARRHGHSTMAGQLEETGPPPPTLTGPLVLPAPQAFSSIGQLYHGTSEGCAAWSTATGKGKSSCASGVCWWVRGWSGVEWGASNRVERPPAGSAVTSARKRPPGSHHGAGTRFCS